MWGPISVDCTYCFRTFHGWTGKGTANKVRQHWRDGCEDDPIGQRMQSARASLEETRRQLRMLAASYEFPRASVED